MQPAATRSPAAQILHIRYKDPEQVRGRDIRLVKTWTWTRTIALMGSVLIVAYLAALHLHIAPGDDRVCKEYAYPHAPDCYASDRALVFLSEIGQFLNEYGALIAAISTVAVACFTWTLKRSTDRLWDEAAKQRAESSRAADAADIQAQWAGKQVEIASQQKSLLRLEYYATHRPMLIVKDVFISKTRDGEPRLTYEIVNSGGSEAKITDGFVALDFVSDETDFKNAAHRSAGAAFDTRLAPGTLKQFTLEIPSPVGAFLGYYLAEAYFPQLKRFRDADVSYDQNLFFFGLFTYSDDRGDFERNEYLCVLRREWTRRTGNFERTGNSDHEYSH